MPRHPGPKAEKIWNNTSYSKYTLLADCELKWLCQSVLKIPRFEIPYAILGTVGHNYFRKFFTPHPKTKRFPFEQKEKLIGSFKGAWWSAVSGKFGFEGWKSPPVKVQWEYPQQPAVLFNQGVKILSLFHENFVDVRQDGTPRIVERLYHFKLGELTIYAKLDRIDLEKDGAVITEYKGTQPQFLIETGTQFTLYQMAYELCIRRKIKNHPPLKAIRVYFYGSGKIQEVPLRSAEEMARLTYLLFEASAYLKGVLTGCLPHPKLVPRFIQFNPLNIISGDMPPNLPRRDHCKHCAYYQQCRDWEEGKLPTARQAFQKKFHQEAQAAQVTQQILPLGEIPIVVQMTDSFSTMLSSFCPAEQLPLGIVEQESPLIS